MRTDISYRPTVSFSVAHKSYTKLPIYCPSERVPSTPYFSSHSSLLFIAVVDCKRRERVPHSCWRRSRHNLGSRCFCRCCGRCLTSIALALLPTTPAAATTTTTSGTTPSSVVASPLTTLTSATGTPACALARRMLPRRRHMLAIFPLRRPLFFPRCRSWSRAASRRLRWRMLLLLAALMCRLCCIIRLLLLNARHARFLRILRLAFLHLSVVLGRVIGLCIAKRIGFWRLCRTPILASLRRCRAARRKRQLWPLHCKRHRWRHRMSRAAWRRPLLCPAALAGGAEVAVPSSGTPSTVFVPVSSHALPVTSTPLLAHNHVE